MSKVERMRARTSDGQEGWNDRPEEPGGAKASWGDNVDPRAPSPGTGGQYNKSAFLQEYQVKDV